MIFRAKTARREILRLLKNAEAAMSGAQLAKDGKILPPALYVALAQLEKEQLVVSDWEGTVYPRSRVYWVKS